SSSRGPVLVRSGRIPAGPAPRSPATARAARRSPSSSWTPRPVRVPPAQARRLPEWHARTARQPPLAPVARATAERTRPVAAAAWMTDVPGASRRLAASGLLRDLFRDLLRRGPARRGFLGRHFLGWRLLGTTRRGACTWRRVVSLRLLRRGRLAAA